MLLYNIAMSKKIERLISSIIERDLKLFGAILIEGPKWCGKTYLGLAFSKSQYYIQENLEDNLKLMNLEWKNNPIFTGDYPRLIDEWQEIPKIWDKIRFIIDMNLNKSGQFILTGSSNVDWTKIRHTGAGRISQIKISTLTFYEILKNKVDNFISLFDLFENINNFKELHTEYGIEWITKNLLIGGWPVPQSNSVEDTIYVEQHIKSLLNIKKIPNLNFNKNVFLNFLKSIARLNGSQLNHQTVLKDLKNQVSLNTLKKYIELIESNYYIDYLDSWNLNVRSKTAIRSKPKMYLCDPSICLNLLGIKSVKQLFLDLRLLGICFENQVIKDLKVYAQNIGANLFYFRNQNGFEIDAILQLNDGRWAPIEIKLNVDDDNANLYAKKLLSISEKIKTNYGINKEPSFYMIITTTKFSYKRDDDVLIIPFTLLKP